MYKAIGVNMNKELKSLRKKSKCFLPPHHYRGNISKNKINEDNINTSSFFDSIENLKDFTESNNQSCKIKSCLKNKESKIDKKFLIASCIGAAAGIIGVSHSIKKKNLKAKKNLLSTAPYLVKLAKGIF